jgi:hypothetical protein
LINELFRAIQEYRDGKAADWMEQSGLEYQVELQATAKTSN